MKKTKKWSLQYRPGDAVKDAEIVKLAKELSVSDVMAQLLYTRGYHTAREAQIFLHQEDALFHDPFLLQDIRPAIERIALAIERGERIAIYGDYDVDGVTSVSLLYLYLRKSDADVGYYIPCRSREGYGLSRNAIDTLKAKGVQVMITVDTGITAIDEIEYANGLGIETVVTDHHECRPELPNACAVVNPHRPDDGYPFKELAGVGVIFKVICALEMEKCRKAGISEMDGIRRICNDYADLVAIGTIADVMPAIDENRLIVTKGLRLLERTSRPGLQALMNAAAGGKGNDGKTAVKKRKINSTYIGFVIAPRMNAAGRVSSASIAVELLLADNEQRAKELAEQLCELNTQRQIEENRIAEQAYKKIEQILDEKNDRVIVIDDDTWQQGIIGIVSSRITERYGLPSILISFDGATRGYPSGDDLGKGSGRSIKGMNLVEALADSEDLLTRFGGHELAAGLTIPRCNIDAFRKKINNYAVEHMDDDMLCVCLEADCEVTLPQLSLELAHEIERMEPFGTSNPVPNLILCNAQLTRIIPMGGGKHTKLILEKDGHSISAVWFGVGTAYLPFELMDRVDVLFQLNINEFQNVTSLQMIVQDMRLSQSFEENCRIRRARYEEIRAGATFDETEDVIPTRDDIAVVYTLLRREIRLGHTYFPIRRLLAMLNVQGSFQIGYLKLSMILRIMQELQLCEITEPTEDCYIFDFYFNTAKTSIEKSCILKKLKSQLRKTGEIR
ncbi:MAG: single-stranded-DNA-specific exonuclease RecJ [Clostridia bacterium]|nr:single-stranded-DNA-specific exonuclease RecJ [Clostridia bacterium]